MNERFHKLLKEFGPALALILAVIASFILACLLVAVAHGQEPPLPTGDLFSDSQPDGHYCTWQWNPVDGATGYILRIGTNEIRTATTNARIWTPLNSPIEVEICGTNAFGLEGVWTNKQTRVNRQTVIRASIADAWLQDEHGNRLGKSVQLTNPPGTAFYRVSGKANVSVKKGFVEQ